MKHLIEISRIVTKRKVRKIEIFDDHSLRHKKSKFNEFYEALRTNKFKSDRDAAQQLYGCSPTDPKYRQLKSRFRKRLLNTLFFLDVNLPSASGYDRAYYSCNKDWTLVKTLIWYNAPHTATHLARQVLTTSLKFKFADLIVNCSRILRDYSAENGDERSFDAYNEYLKEYSTILDAEIRSEEIYQRAVMSYNLPFSRNRELAGQIQSYCETLVKLSEENDSPVIYYNMYIVWIYRYEMERDFEGMLEVCEQGEKYIEQNPVFEQESKLILFQTKKMSAYLHLHNYRDGRATAEKCLNHFPEGTDPWFTFMEYYFLLAMHTENYINALAIYNRATDNPKFKKQDSLVQEKWNIFEGYVNFIIEKEGKNNQILLMQARRGFRASKLLSSPALYPREQRIFSVLVIILQILFLLERKSLSKIPEHIERLKKYATRQLKKEEYQRPILFIRLLLQLNKAGFQLEELSNTEKFLAGLEEHPFFYRGLASELEIIPYEKLWSYLLSQLK